MFLFYLSQIIKFLKIYHEHFNVISIEIIIHQTLKQCENMYKKLIIFMIVKFNYNGIYFRFNYIIH